VQHLAWAQDQREYQEVPVSVLLVFETGVVQKKEKKKRKEPDAVLLTYHQEVR
jgi:hypothetical protein